MIAGIDIELFFILSKKVIIKIVTIQIETIKDKNELKKYVVRN